MHHRSIQSTRFVGFGFMIRLVTAALVGTIRSIVLMMVLFIWMLLYRLYQFVHFIRANPIFQSQIFRRCRMLILQCRRLMFVFWCHHDTLIGVSIPFRQSGQIKAPLWLLRIMSFGKVSNPIGNQMLLLTSGTFDNDNSVIVGPFGELFHTPSIANGTGIDNGQLFVTLLRTGYYEAIGYLDHDFNCFIRHTASFYQLSRSVGTPLSWY